MKRLLTAGIFGTILGIVSAGTANASIVSSGFLDEKLTEYALSTSLDLKANQTDLTALSNKIGTLPSAISATAWTAIPYYSENGVNMPDDEYPLPTTIGEQLEFLLNAGDSPIDRMFRVITMLGGNVETDDDPGANFLGLHPLTQKVSSIEKNITLPDGLTVENLYNGWKTPSGKSVHGLSIIAQHNFTTYDPLNDTINTGLKLESGGYLEVLARLFFDHGYEEPNNGVLAPFWYLTKQALRVGEIPHGKTAAGMIDEINTKIGTLPTEYATVGAALTAIKGIAEDAKAAALAAIPDPKQEGSSGKFVLTVDIVGDNATYHWEKIDREGETTTTTE